MSGFHSLHSIAFPTSNWHLQEDFGQKQALSGAECVFSNVLLQAGLLWCVAGNVANIFGQTPKQSNCSQFEGVQSVQVTNGIVEMYVYLCEIINNFSKFYIFYVSSYRLYNSKAAENDLKMLKDLSTSDLNFAKDIILHNRVNSFIKIPKIKSMNSINHCFI